MKPGDLLRWEDHVTGESFVGLLIRGLGSRQRPRGPDEQWHDIIVLCNGKEVGWTSWQCEIINGNR